jgi:thermitase
MKLLFLRSFLITFFFICSVQPLFAQSELPRKNFENVTTQQYAPNRVIVKFHEGQTKENIEQQVEVRLQERSSILGKIRQQAEDVTIRLGQTSPEEKLKRLIEVENKIGAKISRLGSVNSTISIAKSDRSLNIPQVITELKTIPEVELAEPDYIVKPVFEPDDFYFRTRESTTNERYQWGFDNTSVPQAWDITHGDSDGNVLIAIIDTGAANHVDLSSKIVTTYDCRLDTGCSPGGYNDVYGHGTAVVGIAAAATNNSSGMAGVGFNTKVIVLKIAEDDGTQYWSWAMNALNYLISNYQGKKIVVNMSFGANYYSEITEQLTHQAWNSGFVLIGAAGNSNNDIKFYPADHTDVISVGSSNRFNQKSSYSNFGTWVEVVAPGGDCSLSSFDCVIIPSIDPQTGASTYAWGNGTSFASPFVSGLAALVWAANPSFTNAQVRSRIESTADPITGTGSLWKYGKVNAYRAVTGSGTVPTIIPTSTSSPTKTPTPTPTPRVPGDADGSGYVNVLDLTKVLAQFGTSVSTNTGGDFNGDGLVNLFDLSILLSHFGM